MTQMVFRALLMEICGRKGGSYSCNLQVKFRKSSAFLEVSL